MAMLSHLDLMRMLERGLRRSGLPVSFSGGFHPLPRVQIALALPLGVEAQGEWMDIEFTAELSANDALAQLQSVLPQGIQLLSAASVPVKGPSLATQLQAAVWTFELVCAPEAEAAPSRSQWHQALDALLSSSQLLWNDTDKKGRPRQRDCRPALLQLQLLPVKEQTPLPESHGANFRLEAAIDAMGRSVKPVQVQRWMSDQLGQALGLMAVSRRELQLLRC